MREPAARRVGARRVNKTGQKGHSVSIVIIISPARRRRGQFEVGAVNRDLARAQLFFFFPSSFCDKIYKFFSSHPCQLFLFSFLYTFTLNVVHWYYTRPTHRIEILIKIPSWTTQLQLQSRLHCIIYVRWCHEKFNLLDWITCEKENINEIDLWLTFRV
jgi:hypothetical protein